MKNKKEKGINYKKDVSLIEKLVVSIDKNSLSIQEINKYEERKINGR